MIMMTTPAKENPFLKPFATPYGTAPFDLIKIEHYEPAFEKAIKAHQSEIDAIVANPQNPTFSNTIEAIEYSGEMLSRVSSVFFNLLSAESNDEMMEISQRLSPELSQHSNNINLNEELFKRVKAVYDVRHTSGLTPEQIRLTEKYYENFENSGATLSPEGKEKYRELSMELSKASLAFGQNNLRETNAFEMVLTDKADLTGLPETLIDAAATKAKLKGKEGWLIDLSAPSYMGFMKYSSRRDLREKLYMAYSMKGVAGGEFDNQENVRKIVNLRLEIARLMGYNTYSEYILKNRMAKNEAAVFGLLDRLAEAFTPTAHQELEDVKSFASEMEGKPFDLQPWDWSYYADKLKDNRFDLNDEMTRPYFELENVKKGVFGLATDLYGLQFVRNRDIQVYHPEVEAYEVFDENGDFLSVLYTDFHPRDGKHSGAWMTSFKEQYMRDGKDSRPHVSIVMNFTRPTETKPALLTFDEVKTFLHEFGHALHGMLSKCTYETLSGTSVYRDFVELPSHIMENWLVQKEYLDKFAFHYQTGEKMPEELLQKIVDASNYNVGYATLRQLSFGYLDMAWHSLEAPFEGDVRAFEQDAMARVQLLPVVPETCMSASFSHIFSGGYAAGYYSYKWSEVMDADAFSVFKKNGIFDKETARSFRINILEKGNTEDPMTLFIRFRGQEPSVEALLRRSGIDN
ncbi:Peptidase family M3 dipeptidyl carboxypeptidase [Proteiniphilum saccharofermentans]|uniref:Peptidase family M3 dipeptidyl carboxypeptidase n=2 Tax=Proteiniphilum saccharofermentans TaxID=1642647 RepID=A0A1R3T2Y7_9BACT|nr:Peptidase family M3 dipeptidyl carboxypeptidase [Proteiniphilum saccharofermentans]